MMKIIINIDIMMWAHEAVKSEGVCGRSNLIMRYYSFTINNVKFL